MMPPEQGKSDQQKRDDSMREYREMDNEYQQKWLPKFKDITNYICPGRGQFLPADLATGLIDSSAIINDVASDAGRKLVAAMDTGITSEAREWFTESPASPEDAENDGAREYCHESQTVLFGILSRSNFYKVNRNLLPDVVWYATAFRLIEEDWEDVVRFTHVPCGQYRVAVDAKGRPARAFVLWSLTAAQLVGEFGEEACSPRVREAAVKAPQTTFDVLQHIYQRTERQHGKVDAKNKPWASCWLETGNTLTNSRVALDAAAAPTGLLRESGFDECPFTAPRWNALGLSPYGTESPGWNSIGDVMRLQSEESGGATVKAKIMDPPMNVPTELKNASFLPGAVNPVKTSGVRAEPSQVIPPNAIGEFREDRQVLEQRITRAHYGDVLFLLSADERAQPRTAEEIRGQKEERLLQLGGVFARYSDEDLKPTLARTHAIAARRGLMPEPPEELLQDGKIRVEFSNPLITAQKTIGFAGMQQLIGIGLSVAQAKAAGVDKLDGDEVLDTAAEMLGVKPDLLFSDEELAQHRAERAQQQQAMATGQALATAAPALKDISQIDPEQMRQVVGQFGPNAVAQATGDGA